MISKLPIPKPLVLVVDDSPATLEVLQRNLTAVGCRVLTADGVPGALEILRDSDVDLVITDLKMPGQSGMDLVRHVRENHGNTEVMIITGYPSISGAVEAVKEGAENYLPKPFTDDELIAAVCDSLAKLEKRREQEAAPPPIDTGGLIGQSPAMQRVFATIAKSARANATVLISGESGTGKELVARAIHYNSQRSTGAFVPINCAGIPENLLESELFGHVRGAFTGALQSRAGFFQVADGGTLFLDEIGDLTPVIQIKLLRVLQDKKVVLVGDTKERQIDVRILAATNKDLPALVAKGVFREDLYFRLNVITIAVPPLRERDKDLLLLLDYFAAKYAKEMGCPKPRFTKRAIGALSQYYWPGNVRELENAVQRVVVMSGPEIDAPDLPVEMRHSAARESGLSRTLAEVEADHIRRVLQHLEGNKTHAAEVLGIDRKTLREKIKRFGLDS
ncbi:MAG: sigma-54 dependent transcriptional regulator [Candidatus Lernaella stagnicola]|nr:sigma-54 dependent transcriptional regulator [Candidatus Lernaella stagnicola]